MMPPVNKKIKLSALFQIRDQIAREKKPNSQDDYHVVLQTGADEYTTVKLDENSKQTLDNARLAAVEFLNSEITLAGEPIKVRKKVKKVVPAVEVEEWVEQ